MRRKDKLLHITKLNNKLNENKFSWDGTYANESTGYEMRTLTPKEMTQIMKDAQRLKSKDKFFDFTQDTAVRVLSPASGGGEHERTIVTNYNDIPNTQVRSTDRIGQVLGNMNYTDAYANKEKSTLGEHHTGEYSEEIMSMSIANFLDALKAKDEMSYNIVEEVIEKYFTGTKDESIVGLPGDMELTKESEPTDVDNSQWFSDTDSERLGDKCMDC